MTSDGLLSQDENGVRETLEEYSEGKLTKQQVVELYAFYRYTTHKTLRAKVKKRLGAEEGLAELMSARLPLATVRGKKLAKNLDQHGDFSIDVMALAYECLRWTRTWPGQGRDLGYVQGNAALWLFQQEDPAVHRSALEALIQGVTLDLHDQELVSIPDTLAEFENLIAVNLNYNRLTKTRFPKSLHKLPRLQALAMRMNGWKIFPGPLMQLKGLRALYVGGNNYTDLPTETEWKELEILELSHCNLDAFPEFILGLPSLKVLDLSYNHFRQLPPGLHKLSELRLVSLPRYTLPADIENLKKALPNCRVNGEYIDGSSPKDNSDFGQCDPNDLGLSGLGILCPECLVRTPDARSSFDGRDLCGHCLVDQDARSEQGLAVPHKVPRSWPDLS